MQAQEIVQFKLQPALAECALHRQRLQVAKWGNSLAIRFPSNLLAALGLKEGEEVELHLVGERSFEVVKKPTTSELLCRLRNLRGRLPADFHFDRFEAAETIKSKQPSHYSAKASSPREWWRAGRH